MGTRETQKSCTNQYSPEPWNHTCAMYHLYAPHQPDTKSIENFKKETQKATRQTERANEMKNRFLSNMSHAIRVPLNGVLGFSQIIANEVEIDEPTRKEYADIIQQNTEQLMRLVNNVLDLSRLEAGMMKFQLSDYDIVQLCKDSVGMAQMQNPTLHIHFYSDIDEYIVYTDTNRMMQLIVSILTCPSPSFKEERDFQFTLDKMEKYYVSKLRTLHWQTSIMPIRTLLCVTMSTFYY